MLPPLPIWTFSLQRSQQYHFPNATAHIHKAKRILEYHNIDAKSMDIALRLPLEEERDNAQVLDEEQITLFIECDMEKDQDNIHNALVSIRREFKNSEETKSIMIEVLDYHAGTAGLSCISLHASRTAELAAWEQTSDIIVAKYLSRKRWRTLECTLRGMGAYDCYYSEQCRGG
jgi:hypothetical protein